MPPSGIVATCIVGVDVAKAVSEVFALQSAAMSATASAHNRNMTKQ
jgi:hypothetical protein